MWRVWVGRDRKEVIEIGEVSQERTGKSEQDVGTAKTQFLWILGFKGLNIFCIFIYFILKIIANFLSFEVQI